MQELMHSARKQKGEKKKMTENTATVVIFCAFFALFFSACYVIGEAVLSALGYFG